MKNYIENLINSVENGHSDPFQVAAELKEITDSAKDAFEKIKAICIDILTSIHEKPYTKYGYDFALRNKTTYKYDHIHLIKNGENQIQMLENYVNLLKEIAKKGGGIIPETGEIIDPAIKEENGYILVITKSRKI